MACEGTPGAGYTSLQQSVLKTVGPSRVNFRKIEGPGARRRFRRNMKTSFQAQQGKHNSIEKITAGIGKSAVSAVPVLF